MTAHVNVRVITVDVSVTGAGLNDIRIAKEFKVGPAGLELIGEIFNVLNSKNPAGYIGECDYDAKSGACTNPIFGKPTAYAVDPGQGEQRLAQLGVRIRF